MKLSICMMVKNEEKNLRRCLESLKDIRKNIESELIIVDTGSTDSTLNIAKEFTDKVYFHKWNNDFSAMRNITINYAKGEWIFIIDADEAVESGEKIIDALNSSIPKEYGALTLTVKNFTTVSDNKNYLVNESPRIFRNDGYFKYEGAVHNSPVYKGGLVKIGDCLLHYGYNRDDKELMEYKFNRTSTILKEVLKNDPKNVYYIFQLGVSYNMHNENHRALQEMEKAYSLLINDKMKETYIYIYGEYVQLLIKLEKYEEAKQICLEGISFVDEYIDLYYYLGFLYLKFEQYEEGIKVYLKYLDLINNWDKVSVKNSPALIFKTLTLYDETYYNLAVSYYKKGDYNNAKEYSFKITESKFVNKSILMMFEIANTEHDYNIFKKFLIEKNIYTNLDIKIVDFLEGRFNKFNEKDKIKFLDTFKGKENDYAKLCEIKLKNMLDENCINEIYDFIHNESILEEPYFNNIIYLMLKNNLNTSSYIMYRSESSINNALKLMADNDMNLSKLILKRIDKINNTDDRYEEVRIKKILYRAVLILDNIDEEDYKSVFMEYIELGIEYIKDKYNKSVLAMERTYEFNSHEEVFLYYMMKALENKNKDDEKFISNLKVALKSYPDMSKGIDIILSKFESASKANSEMEVYKKQVKDTIKNLIKNDDLNNAKVIIDEYEKMVKGDMEILLFKSEISLKKSINNKIKQYKM